MEFEFEFEWGGSSGSGSGSGSRIKYLEFELREFEQFEFEFEFQFGWGTLCTWWTKRWWVPRKEVNEVTQQKKQNANTIEGVKNMHRQSWPSWDDCKKVTLTASWNYRTNQKSGIFPKYWDFTKFPSTSWTFRGISALVETVTVGWPKDFKAPHHGRHEDWLFGNLPDGPTVPLEVWNPMKAYDLHLKIGEKPGSVMGSDLTTRWS